MSKNIILINENRFVIAEDGFGWLPGVYDSFQAANHAFSFKIEDLQTIQDEINSLEDDVEKRIISLDILISFSRKDK